MPTFLGRRRRKIQPDNASASNTADRLNGDAEEQDPTLRRESDVSNEGGQSLVLLPGPSGPPEVGLGVRTLHEPQDPTEAVVE